MTTVPTAGSAWAYACNQWGGPVLPPAPTVVTSFNQRIMRFLVIYVGFFVCWPLIAIFAAVSGKLSWSSVRDLYHTVNYADNHPISKHRAYQDIALLGQVYQLDSSQPYLQRSALEWQPREGFCAGTTVRCLIKSFPTIPIQHTPSVTAGSKTPEDVCKILDSVGGVHDNNGPKTHLQSRLFRLENVSYEAFLEELQTNLKDPSTRVAVNFLRPALFGWSLPWFLWPIAPISFFSGLYGGHFSFILGTIQSSNGETLVAIFDVNHKYGGTYLVPADRLYHAIKTKDISTNLSRALIFVSAHQSSESE